VKIPRCRATVSEDRASGHWSDPGSPEAKGWTCGATGVLARRAQALLASQETGANLKHQPLSRVKEE